MGDYTTITLDFEQAQRLSELKVQMQKKVQTFVPTKEIVKMLLDHWEKTKGPIEVVSEGPK